MRNFFNFSKNAGGLVVLLCSLFFNPGAGKAQTAVWTQLDEWGDTIVISIVQSDGVCGQPAPIYYDITPPTYDYIYSYDYTHAIARTNQSDPSKRFKVQAGVPFNVTFEFRGVKHFPNSTYQELMDLDASFGNGLDCTKASLSEQTPATASFEVIPQGDLNKPWIQKRLYKNVVFGKSATLGYLIFEGGVEVIYRDAPGSPITHGVGQFPQIILPLFVTGIVEGSVPVLGTTVQPQIPYVVLHAPPGDASSSEFQKDSTVCREFVDTYSEDGSNSLNAAVKIGIAGSVGFIVTTDFEFSVTVSAGLTAGGLSVKTKSNQTCVTTTQGFSTNSLTDNNGGDVFVGYGTDLNYGIYTNIVADPNTCLARIDTALIYSPTGTPRDFVYTEEQIQEQIGIQQAYADDTSLSVRARNNAQNQADVWGKVLAMNNANKSNPNNAVIQSLSFSAGANTSRESSISVLETNSLEVEHYIEFSAGVSAVVEVAGSGVSGGYEYKGSYRYGKTNTNSAQNNKIVRYNLSDNSSGDLFNMTVVRDPMFGTPIFRLDPGTKSSCPYQGGYQRDQPKLKHDGTTNDHITSTGNPIGGTATFLIDICNESNESRNYYLKLNANSNPNNAEVRVAGALLNGNDYGQLFTIPANSCLQNYEVSVKQATQLSYPDLELYLYPECEKNEDGAKQIQSSIFASVFFGNATGVNDLADNSLLSISPNPTSGWLQISLPEGNNLEAVRVLDLSGKTVRSLELGAAASKTELDLSGLPKGIYALQARAEGQVFMKKVVVE